jgi:hypothetical protein
MYIVSKDKEYIERLGLEYQVLFDYAIARVSGSDAVHYNMQFPTLFLSVQKEARSAAVEYNKYLRKIGKN